MFRTTDTITVIDMDANVLAKFYGYDCPSVSDIFAKISNATRIICRNRKGEVRQTFWR